MLLRFESVGLVFSILTEHYSFQPNNTNVQCKNGRNYGNKIKIVYFVVVYQFQNSLGLILLVLGLGGVFGFNLFWAQKVIRIIEQFFTRGFEFSKVLGFIKFRNCSFQIFWVRENTSGSGWISGFRQTETTTSNLYYPNCILNPAY